MNLLPNLIQVHKYLPFWACVFSGAFSFLCQKYPCWCPAEVYFCSPRTYRILWFVLSFLHLHPAEKKLLLFGLSCFSLMGINGCIVFRFSISRPAMFWPGNLAKLLCWGHLLGCLIWRQVPVLWQSMARTMQTFLRHFDLLQSLDLLYLEV